MYPSFHRPCSSRPRSFQTPASRLATHLEHGRNDPHCHRHLADQHLVPNHVSRGLLHTSTWNCVSAPALEHSSCFIIGSYDIDLF